MHKPTHLDGVSLQDSHLLFHESAATPTPDSAILGAMAAGARSLHLFRAVLDDAVGRGMIQLLDLLSAQSESPQSLAEAYAAVFALLAGEAGARRGSTAGDPWRDHLLERLLVDENPFSLAAQRIPLASMGRSLVHAAQRDLDVLHALFGLDGDTVVELLRARGADGGHGLVSWKGLAPESKAHSAEGFTREIARLLAAGSDLSRLMERLASRFADSGVGAFARYHAFRWVRDGATGRLEGVEKPDPIRLSELVEYQRERALLIQNTEQFVSGLPANNALLYGDRGTGKSSTIKALIQEYGDRGLRLIEMPKGLLGDFPRVLRLLRGRRERFILFVDDLSFDVQETSYKELKAVLEGSVEARPENVLVYATSNRRHLIQELFSDRMEGNEGEVRRWDTQQEKLSLSDRFGITLVFPSPDQERYLRIVGSLVTQRGLSVDEDELRGRAIKWAAQQGGFSGRTARQFADHLSGELQLASRNASCV